MAVIHLPQRYYTQPQGALELDSFWLQRKPAFIAALAVHNVVHCLQNFSFPADLTAGGGLFSIGLSPTVTPRGKGHNFQSGAGFSFLRRGSNNDAFIEVPTGSDWSLVALIDNVSYSGTNSAIFRSAGGSGSNFILLPSGGIWVRNNGTDFTSSAGRPAAGSHLVAGASVQSGSRVRGFINGRMDIDASTSSTTGSFTGVDGINLWGVNGGTESVFGNWLLITLWHSALTQEEQHALAENPWQIFRARSLRIKVSEGAGSTFDIQAVSSAVFNGASEAHANLDSDAAALAEFNGASEALADLDTDAIALAEFNGASEALADLDADATATLTWDGAAVAVADFLIQATALVEWIGAEVSAADNVFSMTAVADAVFVGASEVLADLDADAAALVQFDGASEARADLDADAIALAEFNGAPIAVGDLDSDTIALAEFNGASEALADLDTDAAALAEFNGASEAHAVLDADASGLAEFIGEEGGVTSTELFISATADLQMTGASVIATDLEIDVTAEVRFIAPAVAASALTWGYEKRRQRDQLEANNTAIIALIAAADREIRHGYY